MLEYIWNLIHKDSSKDVNPMHSSNLISETLLEELNGCIKELESYQRERDAQLKRESGKPDYSWLMNESVKQYKIPQYLRLELEDLCLQIEPDVAPLVINDFRRVVTQEMPVEKIPYCFKSVLKRQLIIQNLKTEAKDGRKSNKSPRDSSGFFKRRLEVPYLGEKDLEAWGTSSNGPAEARVSSAPASSWRFFRQSRIKPTDSTANQADFVKSDGDKEETRRANSLPTITTIV